MAAEEGFEPSQTESESVVLPLHNSAIWLVSVKLTKIIISISLQKVKPLYKKILTKIYPNIFQRPNTSAIPISGNISLPIYGVLAKVCLQWYNISHPYPC